MSESVAKRGAHPSAGAEPVEGAGNGGERFNEACLVDGDVSAATAKALLEALSPLDEVRWGPPGSWIFRGQASATWPLRASADRGPGAFAKVGHPVAAGGRPETMAATRRMLAAFHQVLDEAGLPIPSLPNAGMMFGDDGADFDVHDIPLMALAQHHSLPTPLLDWTTRPRVAAYFAASFALANHDGQDADLAVYALRLPVNGGGEYGSSFGQLQIYRAPGYTNPNLRAQNGLFTILRTGDGRSEAADSIDGYLATQKRSNVAIPALRRFRLRIREAEALLRLLASEGVTGASLFPGADGIVRAMRERALWGLP